MPRVPAPRRLAGALASLSACLLASGGLAQTVVDPELSVSVHGSGLSLPTTMAFVDDDDILVLEKNTGRVRRVLNGVTETAPVLTVPVAIASERGMLGIAVNAEVPPGVFLYYTEATSPSGTPIANRVYRYDWNASLGVLENPQLVLDLPVLNGPNHNGGVLALGPPDEEPGVGDGALLYALIGDLNRDGQLENFPARDPPDDTAVIFRVQQDGTASSSNPFTPYCSTTTTTTCVDDGDCPGGETCTTVVERYFAYGVRNGFGLTLDPVTGDLWDTENGPATYDEVNRVEPGMNSGWERIMGPDDRDPQDTDDLWDMPGAGSTYSDPEMSWLDTIAPTAIVFPQGSALGAAYDDMVLVGDNNLGQIYALPLTPSRDALDVQSLLGGDLVADSDAERDQFLFGEGFGSVTDLEIGPDGALYVVSITDGAIYRVRQPVDLPALGGGARLSVAALMGVVGALALVARRRRR